MSRVRTLLATFGLGLAAASAASATITVGAQSDIFLAGQTIVPTDFPYNASAPGAPNDGAGALPVAYAVTAGETLDITATGLVSCCFGGSPTNGPDGGGLGGPANISGYGDVGPFVNPVSFPLVGVFGGSGLTTPWTIFVIGSSDVVTVPTGATELYLGLPDALGFDSVPGYYNDNTGSFSVSIAVPESATWALILAGFAGLGASLRSNRRTIAARS